MKPMEMMIGGSVGIEDQGSYLRVHTRFSMLSGMGLVMVQKISGSSGISGIGGAPSDRYSRSIHIGDLFSIDEILPQIKAIIAKYAPREYI